MMTRSRMVPLATMLAGVLAVSGCATSPAASGAPPTTAAKPASAPTSPPPTTAPVAAAPTVPAPTAAPAATAAPATETFDEQAVANFYRGQTVHIEVGSVPGGGFDTFARLIAHYIGKYIPGNPAVVVGNNGAAGGAVLANEMWSSQPKDGTVIATFPGGIFLNRALGQKELQFEMTGWGHLGAPSTSQYVCEAVESSGWTNIRDAMPPTNKELVLGAVPGQAQGQEALVKQALNANIRIVTGYNGTAAVRLAEQQGEVAGQCGNSWQSLSATNMDDLKSGKERILLQLISQPRTDLPQGNAPTIFDLAQSDDDRLLARVSMEGPGLYDRPYVLPPGVPRDRLLALRRAFEQSMTDPDLIADAKKANLALTPVKADVIESRLAEAANLPDPVKAKLRDLFIQPAS